MLRDSPWRLRVNKVSVSDRAPIGSRSDPREARGKRDRSGQAGIDDRTGTGENGGQVLIEAIDSKSPTFRAARKMGHPRSSHASSLSHPPAFRNASRPEIGGPKPCSQQLFGKARWTDIKCITSECPVTRDLTASGWRLHSLLRDTGSRARSQSAIAL